MRKNLQILGITACLAAAITPAVLSAQTSSSSRCDSIQYRFVKQGAPISAPRRRSVQDGQWYALRDSIVVDGRDIAEIKVWAHSVGRDTTWDVLARLTPAGATAMATATGNNPGQMLAVVLGDTIIEHGIINGPLGSRIPVRLRVTRKEADSLAFRARRASGPGCNIPWVSSLEHL